MSSIATPATVTFGDGFVVAVGQRVRFQTITGSTGIGSVATIQTPEGSIIPRIALNHVVFETYHAADRDPAGRWAMRPLLAVELAR